MSEQSPFNRQPLQEAPLLVNPGLLDQLGLPPKAVRYMRQNQRQIWLITGCIAALITAISFYNSYISYRAGKAASALTAALKAEEAKRPELLSKVVADYGSVDAGRWARLELVKIMLAKGDTDKAIAELEAARKSVGRDNPLSPLLLFQLAGLYENKKKQEQALSLYSDLSQFKGFGARAYEAMGRIYEQQNKKDKALEMYQKYLGEGGEKAAASAAQAPADPEREMIQARINALQEK